MVHHKVIANATGGEAVQFTQAEEDQLAVEVAEGEANLPSVLFGLLREERNSKLATTDWQANSDVQMGANVATYRQQLRDFPAQYTDETILGAIVWPVKPE